MAIVRPFRAIRPAEEKAKDVAALPYDVMSSDEARKMVIGNPYSFLHVDKAEIDLDPSINIYDDRVYEKAKENLNRMIADGTFLQEGKPCFYIYRLSMNGRSQTGLVGCTSVDEYECGVIKKHELTRAEKEQDRIRHVDACNANTGPIFMAYRDEEAIDMLVDRWIKSHTPVYDFTAEDGIGHTVWVIDDEGTISFLMKNFQKIDSLYIADGHHRNASAVKVAQKRREKKGSFTGDEEFNYYLAVLFPKSQLNILDYNRVVKDLNGNTPERLIEKLQEKFIVTRKTLPVKPQKQHTFGMYLAGIWYLLEAKENILSADAVEGLDVSILQKEVLHPILGIGDIRKDSRIDFVGGIRGLTELEKLVDSGQWAVAFSMYPTSLDELMRIADDGKIMPPKSTWFEPKLRSGLFIHSLEG
ncbi:MAG: DUF1015 domain-containing protein [Clostridiales bacterium]|nr:DUF1015 domain-containing protein [Clostridiales bacterium]